MGELAVERYLLSLQYLEFLAPFSKELECFTSYLKQLIIDVIIHFLLLNAAS